MNSHPHTPGLLVPLPRLLVAAHAHAHFSDDQVATAALAPRLPAEIVAIIRQELRGQRERNEADRLRARITECHAMCGSEECEGCEGCEGYEAWLGGRKTFDVDAGGPLYAKGWWCGCALVEEFVFNEYNELAAPSFGLLDRLLADYDIIILDTDEIHPDPAWFAHTKLLVPNSPPALHRNVLPLVLSLATSLPSTPVFATLRHLGQHYQLHSTPVVTSFFDDTSEREEEEWEEEERYGEEGEQEESSGKASRYFGTAIFEG